MHTLANKVSARERELAPKYYYKRQQKTTWIQKLQNALRIFISFMFTQVGVIVLIGLYMLLGAVIFERIEADSQMEVAKTAKESRENFTLSMWRLTESHNVLNKRVWSEDMSALVLQFQESVVVNVKDGHTGKEPGVRVWTFSSSLMYSLTIFTTIGYGNLTPRTSLGKVVTMLYALTGIPLMFIYMANIGNILATSFKYTYSKMCRCEDEPEDLPKKAELPSIRMEDDYIFPGQDGISRRGSSSTCSPSESVLLPLGSSLVPPSLPHLRAPAHLPSSLATLLPPSSLATLLPPYSPTTSRRLSMLSQAKGLPPINCSQEKEKEEVVKFKLVEDISLVTIPVTTCLMVLMSYILCGAVIFSVWEEWSILDGAYFCFTSLMTIGFGDFVPGNSYIYSEVVSEEESSAKIVLGTVYLLLGMAVMSMCINLVQEEIVTQVRVFARSMGLIREYRGLEDSVSVK